MSLQEFHLTLFYNAWEGLVLILICILNKLHACLFLFACLFACWESISLLVIGMFKLSTSSWFNLGRLYVSKHLSLGNISLGCSTCQYMTDHSASQSLSWFWLLATPGTVAPPGSSSHEIRQARILRCVAIPLSRGFYQPRDQTWVSCITGRSLTVWAARAGLDCSWYSLINP